MTLSHVGLGFVAALLALGTGCSSTNSTHAANDGGAGQDGMMGTCANPTPVADNNTYGGCGSCSAPAGGCLPTRSLDACCAWVQAPPTTELTRGTGLHYFSSNDATVDLGCLATPAAKGTSKTVTLNGWTRLFSSGDANGDSLGVKVEVFLEGQDGALGTLVGSYTTNNMNAAMNMLDKTMITWPTKCPSQGCTYRAISIPNVPTETPLIVKTSDGTGGSTPTWAELYDYNVYFSANVSCASAPTAAPCVDANGNAQYYASAVAVTDVNTVATVAGGFTVKPDKGLLAGEIHDCGDVRLQSATIDTDVPHEGPMFYFGADETNPLPDQTRAQGGLGTSTLGLFGALNFATGMPIRISAAGQYMGQPTLIGTYVVQVFPGAVTALSLRGRRPYQ